MSQAIAQTILAQLGGNRFTIMTGAKNYVSFGAKASEHVLGGLQFSIGRNKSKANKVSISLMSNDTYTVEFGNLSMKTLEYSVISKHTDVYADDLRNLFERVTGLYTKL